MYDTSLSPRFRLKHATGAAHAALEAHIGPLITQSAYNEYVLGLEAFRRVTEAWLMNTDANTIGAWEAHSLSPALSADLSDLGLTPIAFAPAAWLSADQRSFAMGVHYVLEGSALGARVLCKQVAPLGLHRDYGARHLWTQVETPQNWRSFVDALNAHDGDEDALIAGANAAFTAAAHAMERAADV